MMDIVDGILAADKPEGWTSHDVVAAVKKKLSARKVGHLGTLDPLATGVLPLVINGATKYAGLFGGGEKEYAVRLKLGEETDTCDSEGRVTSKGDISLLTVEAVRAVLSGFKGKIMQVPPMYSALKRNGVPLYKLARKGITVEREPREVEIFSLDITGIPLPYADFRVVCSKGTYIRSICSDAGKALGCGGHMVRLRRTFCSGFSEAESVSPGEDALVLRKRIIPLEDALRRLQGRGGPAACMAQTAPD